MFEIAQNYFEQTVLFCFPGQKRVHYFRKSNRAIILVSCAVFVMVRSIMDGDSFLENQFSSPRARSTVQPVSCAGYA